MARPVLSLAVALLLALTGCGAATGEGEDRAGADRPASTSTSASSDAASGEVPTTAPPPDATVGTQPARIDDLAPATGPTPTGLVIDDLGIDAAILPVGVETDGAMEVPPADQVGWYRFGPAPGDDGSTVLAAHVDYDGERGVFFELRSIQPGATVEVLSSDGSRRRFTVDAVTQVAKVDLGTTAVFDRTGPPRLALITCGGTFDEDARSYRDNIVVTAVPEA
jgi:sortase (surface protein transpeptidase)